MLITSASNPRIKAIRKLRDRKYREQSASHLVEGVRAIEEGLDNAALVTTLIFNESALRESKELQHLLQRISEIKPQPELLAVTTEVLSSFSSRSNPHLAIAVFDQRWMSLEEIKEEPNHAWIALEAPRDPGNVGTIIRTAEAAGARGVILLDQSCDPYSPEAMRASTGALFGISLVKSTRDTFIAWAKQSAFELVGTGLARSQDYRELPYTAPTIIVMGTEKDGITDTLENACDFMAKIPMRGKTDSLNLSIASGLMLFEVMNRKATYQNNSINT